MNEIMALIDIASAELGLARMHSQHAAYSDACEFLDDVASNVSRAKAVLLMLQTDDNYYNTGE